MMPRVNRCRQAATSDGFVRPETSPLAYRQRLGYAQENLGVDPGQTVVSDIELIGVDLLRNHRCQRGAQERAEWNRGHPGERSDPAVFRAEILPGLAGVPVERIASETSLSLAHVWRIRKGQRVPHPRFWPALADLASDAAGQR